MAAEIQDWPNPRLWVNNTIKKNCYNEKMRIQDKKDDRYNQDDSNNLDGQNGRQSKWQTR